MINSAYSQNLFWADKEVISDGISFFSSFKSSDTFIYSAWQNVSYFPNNSGGISSLVIKKSKDGYVWEEIKHNIEPVEFYGSTPIRNYSMDTNSDGDLIIAYSKGDSGAYNEIEIYNLSNLDSNLKKLTTIKYDRAVLAPTINYRGDNGSLGYILFVSHLKDLTTVEQEDGSEIVLESGALSIFYTMSDNGILWNENSEFINTISDQSYLPIYKYFNNREYVVYQSIITSNNQNNNFQLFAKTKSPTDSDWGEDYILTDTDEFITGTGNEIYTEFDNQRASFTTREGKLGLTWERSYGYESSKIYYSEFSDSNKDPKLLNIEKITTGSRSCSRPRGFEFNSEFYLLWFDNQLGSNDVVMASPDKLSGFWIENIISDDRNYLSVFGDFIQFNNTLRIYWEDQNINRDSYNQSRGRIQALNPDKDVDSPIIISDYKDRDNKISVRFTWTKPKDSSGIKGYYYSWFKKDSTINFEKRVLSNVTRSEFLNTDTDGEYIFSIYAEDNAGNLSESRKYVYTFDITPPDNIKFPEIKSDEKGFLISNSESLLWDSFDDDVVGFSHTLTYLGFSYEQDTFDISKTKKSNNYTPTQSYSFNNIDDGYYALTVQAKDIAGNIGNPEAIIFKLNKYIPVTYISFINYSQNKNGELITTIHGRGFKSGGDVTTVILDKDGVEPYDYTFKYDSEVFNVVTDRRIEGPNLDEIEGGVYRVGIIHPIRGTFFSNPIIKVESTGTIKFGDFTEGYEEVWQRVKPKSISISFELVIFILAITIAILVFIITLIRLILISRESKRLVHDAKALAHGTPFLKEKDILRIRNMKKKGIGLQVKFTVAIIALIVGVIALISLPLASFMIDTQKKNLTDALVSRTEILLNSISTGAKDFIERGREIELDNLIKTSESMDEVIWATIVGVSSANSEITNALWAYTDESTVGYFTPLPETINSDDFNSYITNQENIDILQKTYNLNADVYELIDNITLTEDLNSRQVLTDSGYPRDITLGQTIYKDKIEDDVNNKVLEIETKGTTELLSKKEELIQLAIDRNNATEQIVKEEIQDTIALLSDQINEALKKMSSNTGQFPKVDYQKISEYDSFLFYKPVLYNEPGVNTFYKGMVRLEVSTETINTEINNSIRNLTFRVGFTAIVAILIGFVGAFILASFMINPIKKLVLGVQIIRDTEDKSSLKSHEIIVKSRDELFTLASTVNQMTEGLVKAAALSKDVTMGKEIQKMFIPLELSPDGEGKLTTGEFENDEISVFGYYEGAKGVSGDYFDYRQIDEDHFAMIKCDIAGKGIPASLIMVEVATIFLAYFRKWDRRKEGYRIDELVYSMNDLLEERGFKGRFAAFIVVIMNTKTGKCHMCNAGDNLVHLYRSKQHIMETITLHEVPAAGIFSSEMLESGDGYKVETTTLEKNDILFLFTDGVEESKHLFRDENYNEILCTHPGLTEGQLHDTHALSEGFEELGVPRINEILHAVIHKTTYYLRKYHYPEPEATFTFDFSSLTGAVKDAVLGLISVEKVFRLNPDPSAGAEDNVKIDKVVNNFLMKHFDEYSDYYKFKVDKGEDAQHDFFSHIKEDDQYDDLTILAIKKK
ncbi:MAG: SpoIIE family protein phosphatase [Spirochaetaceae bacterium]